MSNAISRHPAVCMRSAIIAMAALSATTEALSAAEWSTTSVAVNTGSLSPETRVYLALMKSTDWSGDVRAYRVSEGPAVPGGVCPKVERGQLCEDLDDPYWDASARIPGPDARVLITRADNQPAAFQPTVVDKLSHAQRRGLLCVVPETSPCVLTDPLEPGDAQRDLLEARIRYLRGDRASAADLGFRERSSLLGDIVNSKLLVVGPPASVFPDPSYQAFRQAQAERPELVYVGANDGMIHAFAGKDGREVFAYVPQAIYSGLANLSDPGYGQTVAKRSFVDGTMRAADVQLGGSWQTLLIGGLGFGAQGVYALNITDPQQISEAKPEALALWEFTDASANEDGADGRDMGFSFAAPAIVRIDNDTSDETPPVWVALVGNGYDNTSQSDEIPAHCHDDDDATPCTISQTGNAVLYVLNIDGGDDARIRAILDTGEGHAPASALGHDAPSSERSNGLAQVTAVDHDHDLVADAAYAGDLFGNLWRFDLTDLSTAPARVFSAVDGDENPQPITTKIAVARHPSGIGLLLLFGTGHRVGTGYQDDASEPPIQSFYGIWDDGGVVYDADSPPTREDLLRQAFTGTTTVGDGTQGLSSARVSTNNSIAWSGDAARRGWYIDLSMEGGAADGERVVGPAQVRHGRVVFVSVVPGGCCDADPKTWVNVLDSGDGSPLSVTPFDFNADGSFDKDDLPQAVNDGTQTTDVAGSSIGIDASGTASPPALLDLGLGQLQGVVATPDGRLIDLLESTGLNRRNWRQLR